MTSINKDHLELIKNFSINEKINPMELSNILKILLEESKKISLFKINK